MQSVPHLVSKSQGTCINQDTCNYKKTQKLQQTRCHGCQIRDGSLFLTGPFIRAKMSLRVLLLTQKNNLLRSLFSLLCSTPLSCQNPCHPNTPYYNGLVNIVCHTMTFMSSQISRIQLYSSCDIHHIQYGSMTYNVFMIKKGKIF